MRDLRRNKKDGTLHRDSYTYCTYVCASSSEFWKIFYCRNQCIVHIPLGLVQRMIHAEATIARKIGGCHDRTSGMNAGIRELPCFRHTRHNPWVHAVGSRFVRLLCGRRGWLSTRRRQCSRRKCSVPKTRKVDPVGSQQKQDCNMNEEALARQCTSGIFLIQA